jgi:hypothetical protein
VANDLKLQGRHRADAPAPAVPRAPPSIYLLTAPNTSGKSTFLRSNAIIVILAQAGCYVPAQAARVGIVDRVFSRVGASDDLPGARSTFMVEMEEAAAFLTQATPRSLVIVDELGRGTSPEEGLAIAWATLEELARIGCRALFATHFHRLVKPGGPVEASAGAIACVTTRVSTAQDGALVCARGDCRVTSDATGQARPCLRFAWSRAWPARALGCTSRPWRGCRPEFWSALWPCMPVSAPGTAEMLISSVAVTCLPACLLAATIPTTHEAHHAASWSAHGPTNQPA